MLAEITKLRGDDSLDEVTYETIKEVVQSLVQMLDEASQIVDFFKKFDEQKTVKKNIKRMVIKHFDLSLVKPVTDRFMELAQVKFK
jgi:type I restriction enzyme R subunit